MTDEEYLDYLKTIPEHVSWQVQDAWLAIPPCNGSIPYCHGDCPYYYECYPDTFDEP